MNLIKSLFMLAASPFLVFGSNRSVQSAFFVQNLTNVTFPECNQLNITDLCYDDRNISFPKNLTACSEEKNCCFSNDTLHNYTICLSSPSSSVIENIVYTEAGFAFIGIGLSILVSFSGGCGNCAAGTILFFFGSAIGGGIGTALGYYLIKSETGAIALTTVGMFSGSFSCLIPCKPVRARHAVVPVVHHAVAAHRPAPIILATSTMNRG